MTRFTQLARCGAGVVFGALALAAGCAQQSDVELNRRISELSEQLQQREQQVQALQAANEEMKANIDRIRGFSPEQLQLIVAPQRLEIASLSGGRDFDNQPGDDGVRIFLKPIDQDGDAIKVAGDIRVDLFDLSEPGGDTLIGSVSFPAQEVGKHWYGKLVTYHYTLDCPWKRPPDSQEVTARVTFVDYITKRLLTTQAVFKVAPQRTPG